MPFPFFPLSLVLALRNKFPQYYAFPTISVDRYQHLHDEQGQVLPVDLTVMYGASIAWHFSAQVLKREHLSLCENRLSFN